MDLKDVINVNVEEGKVLITPENIKALLPMSEVALDTVISGRNTVKRVITRQDKRLMVIVGPCSIHDPRAALDYATRLKRLADEVSDHLFIVMRVYFEKPRTTVGWKGLINDPFLNNSFEVEDGLKIARKLLLALAELGLPTGTEALDPITPQYLSELISWAAIGARTVESQTHREMASGLSMPVGFKNGTDGNIQTAIDAMKSALSPHNFLGINQQGQICTFKTRGNPYGHLVLRGGGLRKAIVVDCSHGNSNKDHTRQPEVFADCLRQVADGNQSIIGLMIESNLNAGNQSIPETITDLRYGISVTDKCLDWETTEATIRNGHRALKAALA